MTNLLGSFVGRPAQLPLSNEQAQNATTELAVNKIIGYMSFQAESLERGIFPLGGTKRFLREPRNDMRRLVAFLPVYFVNTQNRGDKLVHFCFSTEHDRATHPTKKARSVVSRSGLSDLAILTKNPASVPMNPRLSCRLCRFA